MASHQHDLSPWTHDHVFDTGNQRGESRTRWVLAVTLLTMGVEIFAGWWTGSMALLADGWHMGTHAIALGVAAFAYWLSRRHATDRRYAQGSWKIEVLGAFASALVLGLVALGIIIESLVRLWNPHAISARDALIVAVVGLVVNLVSAWLLHGAEGGHGHHGHDHGHGHAHVPAPAKPAVAHDHDHAHQHAQHDDHDHGHVHGPACSHDDVHDTSHVPHDHTPGAQGTDLNLRAAYVHVLADALTSVFAIIALAGALWFGWTWLDAVVGLVGAVVIAVWAVGLLRQSAAVLLDREMDHPLAAQIRQTLESDGDTKVADLHLWRVGREKFSAVACVVADHPLSAADYRQRLAVHGSLVHMLVEVNQCPAGQRPHAH